MTLPESCPRCGAPTLEPGHITGQMAYLNWIRIGESPGPLTIGKEHLATGSLTKPPMLAAVRCGSCGLGMFESGA